MRQFYTAAALRERQAASDRPRSEKHLSGGGFIAVRPVPERGTELPFMRAGGSGSTRFEIRLQKLENPGVRPISAAKSGDRVQ